ncbi:lipid-A-disaccharide synthase [Alteromonas sediminis]|uniref:Lipid-A-disaccharide synthase n=1 Tax=Alteromonas sediminis TaxID=2259342 RepID=A0A3N5YET8_9ALTE|nr:lipid-A-disaccharide synthase [Alteromonas sediminis]RPJ68375.1 lipid-A-disaccharide synthase [Alteromonas sediminis]
MPPLRIGIVAGEASGDLLAAGMIREIRARYPDAIIEGIGGHYMQAQGFTSLFDMETLSVMGLVEVLGRLPAILKLKKALLAHFAANPPDVFVGVDAPDFNLRIEAALKKQGIPTVHYVSPTVWAWREKRIHKIAKATSLVMGVFPFEAPVYEKYAVPYEFVGHTMADTIPLHPSKDAARTALELNTNQKLLAILPGSRSKEVSSLLPIFIDAFDKLDSNNNYSAIIPAANRYRYAQIEALLADENVCPGHLRDKIQLVQGHSRDAMIASDAILLASGTASLEAMLCKRPMVVAYKMSGLTYKIMQRLYKPDFFSLPNILANEALVPEVLQEQVNGDNLARLLKQQLQKPVQETEEKFIALHQSLKCNADARSADAVLSLIGK